MPLPGYSAPPATDTTLIVGLSIFISFSVFTFIACFCCQGCPLNKFYIRKRVNEGNMTCPSCRQRGHVPVVLSNENGLVATCATRDCQPMLLGPSANGYAAPYPICDAHRLGWNMPHGQPLTEINVIYPTDDPPPYHESYTGKRSDRCIGPLRSCYESEAETESSPSPLRHNLNACEPANSVISRLTERGRHVLVDVVQEAFISRPWHQEEAEAQVHMLSDRRRHSSSYERDEPLERTTVV